MAGTSVRISGLPSTCNPMKIQFLFSSECKVSIKSLKIDNDDAEVILASKNDADIFRQCLPKTISFGGSTFTVTLSANQPVQTDHAEGAGAAQAKQNDADMHEVDNTRKKRKQSDLATSEPDNKVYSWSDMDELPSCKKGLLVQCQREIHRSPIRNYFESDLNGGPILEMIKMFDGLLIIFKNEEDASKAWSQRPHRVSGIRVPVFVKFIPGRFEKKLVVQNKNKEMKEKDLKKMLLAVSPNSIAPASIKPFDSLFLVTYSMSNDSQDVRDIVDDFELTHKGIKIFRLPKTDCLKVENASGFIFDEEYKILFENNEKSHGGPVTKIQRVKDDVLLVYFASYADAETVFKMFQTSFFDFFGHQLQIKRYFHCLNELHKNDLKASTPRAFVHKQIPRTEALSLYRPGHSERVNSDVNHHASDHTTDEVVVPMANGKMKYLIQYCEDFKKLCSEKSVITFMKDDVGITINGQRGAVREVRDQVSKSLPQILHEVVPVQKFGAFEYFNGKEGMKIIKDTASEYNTAILFEDAFEVPNKAEFTWKTPQGAGVGKSSQGQTDRIQIGPLSISLREGDITEEKTDAIVNCTLLDFKLDKGGLSSIIVKKAGGKIQSEVDRKDDKLIRLTSSGSLPCKKLFHAITPSVETEVSGCVRMLLELADEKKCATLAIPSIGTGPVAGMHANVVSRKMLDGFHEFALKHQSTKQLRDVKIVIRDPALMPDFNMAFMEHQDADAMPTLQRNTNAGTISKLGASAAILASEQFGSITVSVRQGDITLETNDAIVNSTNTAFDLTNGMVSRAILNKGGYEIMHEIRQSKGKKIRITHAGKLRCKKIIHVATPTSYESELKACFLGILIHAEQAECSSVSIPAIGTGNLKMRPKDVSRIMVKAFMEFGQRDTKCLKIVDIVIFDGTLINDFVKEFNIASKTGGFDKITQRISAGWSNITSALPNVFSSSTGSNVDPVSSATGPAPRRAAVFPSDQLRLHFYTMDPKDIELATMRIKDEMNSVFSIEVIVEDSVLNLDADGVQKLADCGQKHRVQVQKSERQITIEGLKKDVHRAVKEIRDMLQKVPQTSPQKVSQTSPGKDPMKNSFVNVWKIEQIDGTYRQLPYDISNAIEEKYLMSTVFVGKIKVQNEEYELDLLKRKLNDRLIRRALDEEWKSNGTKTSQPHSARYSDDDVA